MALSITDLKKGAIFEYMGDPYRVVDYSQKVMGRGGSIVNVKIKNLIDNKVLEKTFKGNDQLNEANVSLQNVQYLYRDNDDFYFMSEESFEQFNISSDIVSDKVNYLKEGEKVILQFFNGHPVNIDLPKNVALKVVYTEDAIKGDTSSAITKDAELETGLVIKVPAFIKKDDLISVDTTSGAYRERIK